MDNLLAITTFIVKKRQVFILNNCIVQFYLSFNAGSFKSQRETDIWQKKDKHFLLKSTKLKVLMKSVFLVCALTQQSYSLYLLQSTFQCQTRGSSQESNFLKVARQNSQWVCFMLNCIHTLLWIHVKYFSDFCKFIRNI